MGAAPKTDLEKYADEPATQIPDAPKEAPEEKAEETTPDEKKE